MKETSQLSQRGGSRGRKHFPAAPLDPLLLLGYCCSSITTNHMLQIYLFSVLLMRNMGGKKEGPIYMTQLRYTNA